MLRDKIIVQIPRFGGYNTIFSKALCNNQPHISKTMDIYQIPRGQIPVRMDLFLRLFQTSLGFYTDFKPTLVYMDLLCWLFYSFFWSWGDQGQWPETKGIPVWLLNISWVLKWSGTKLYVHSFTLAALLHLSLALYLSAIKFNNTSSLPMVCINVSLFTIVDYETVVSKRLIIFHSYFANFNITFYRDKWMNKL